MQANQIIKSTQIADNELTMIASEDIDDLLGTNISEPFNNAVDE